MSAWNTAALDAAGLNLQAVFDIDSLPPAMAQELRRRFDPGHGFRQLILIGHGGRRLWERVQAAGMDTPDPVDSFSQRTAESWFAAQFPGHRHAVAYPGDPGVGLQALGKLAGWHHDSPFMVGINAAWGPWFAYRVLLLADTALAPTPPLSGTSPCATCGGQACVAACPAEALSGGQFRLERCIAYRRQPDSRCRSTCLARQACPVGAEHRYTAAQLHHSYGRSLDTIGRRR